VAVQIGKGEVEGDQIGFETPGLGESIFAVVGRNGVVTSLLE
jgi:hypothetical protein